MFSHHEKTTPYLVDSKYSVRDDAVTINSIIPVITLTEVSQSAVAGACNETLHLGSRKAENRGEVGQAITSKHTSSCEAPPPKGATKYRNSATSWPPCIPNHEYPSSNRKVLTALHSAAAQTKAGAATKLHHE